MRLSFLAFAAAVALLPSVAGAQAPSPSASQTEASKTSRAEPKPRAARARKEPSLGQMAARERQKKCGAEWKEAKAAGKTGGQKWPQFWSACNARLKGNAA